MNMQNENDEMTKDKLYGWNLLPNMTTNLPIDQTQLIKTYCCATEVLIERVNVLLVILTHSVG